MDVNRQQLAHMSVCLDVRDDSSSELAGSPTSVRGEGGGGHTPANLTDSLQ